MKVFNKNSFISIISKNLKLLVTSSPRIMIFFILWSIIYAGIDPLILYIDKMFIELLNIHLENNTMYQQVLTFLFVSLAIKIYRGFHDCMMGYRITSYNVCYTKLLRDPLDFAIKIIEVVTLHPSQ